MGKAKPGFLTPKAIANRIKSKGLQKLRWFCQMCEKQCRDENGFKCHLMSETHQRQLLLFADNSSRYINDFSSDFKKGFLHLLKRQFGTKRVNANMVYQTYIHDREHVHMNATQWETLTDFVKWVGKEGFCVVDQTEKGWFITYIDRDWEAIKKKEEDTKKAKMDLNDDERSQRFIDKQIQRAQESEKSKEVAEATELMRENEEEKVAFAMACAPSTSKTEKSTSLPNALDKLGKEKPSSGKPSSTVIGEKRKASVLDDIIKHEEHIKEKKNRKEYWLHTGIVVKVVTKKLGEKYYKKKGVVKEVVDRFVGVIKMLDTGDRIKVDQQHLETVIPAIGKPVVIVNGAYRGCEAKLVELQDKTFSCSIKISAGPLTGRRVEAVAYEDLSKLYKDS